MAPAGGKANGGAAPRRRHAAPQQGRSGRFWRRRGRKRPGPRRKRDRSSVRVLHHAGDRCYDDEERRQHRGAPHGIRAFGRLSFAHMTSSLVRGPAPEGSTARDASAAILRKACQAGGGAAGRDQVPGTAAVCAGRENTAQIRCGGASVAICSGAVAKCGAAGFVRFRPVFSSTDADLTAAGPAGRVRAVQGTIEPLGPSLS